MRTYQTIEGERWELSIDDERYPVALRYVRQAPTRLYGIGNRDALQEGLAIIGARKATPYGITCAARFARMAAERGIVVISGGARGCDAAAHQAALDAGGSTVVLLGGGCNRLYPAVHARLFQEIISQGGALLSEYEWSVEPRPYMFRQRNRLIASLSKATLIVEAGLPSGTFSTADEALAMNREVLVIPGAITSAYSRGSNRLLYQGAHPIVDDDSFLDALTSLFGCLRAVGDFSLKEGNLERGGIDDLSQVRDEVEGGSTGECVADDDFGRVPNCDYERMQQEKRESRDKQDLINALLSQPLSMEELYELAYQLHPGPDSGAWLSESIIEAERSHRIARYPDGRYGPSLSR